MDLSEFSKLVHEEPRRTLLRIFGFEVFRVCWLLNVGPKIFKALNVC